MRTRVFFNHLTGERFELSQEEVDKRFLKQDGPTFIPDISGAYKQGGILSPIDGSFITSRAQLRRHNNTHQVRCGGDFKPGELISKERKRVETIKKLGNMDFAWK